MPNEFVKGDEVILRDMPINYKNYSADTQFHTVFTVKDVWEEFVDIGYDWMHCSRLQKATPETARERGYSDCHALFMYGDDNAGLVDGFLEAIVLSHPNHIIRDDEFSDVLSHFIDQYGDITNGDFHRYLESLGYNIYGSTQHLS